MAETTSPAAFADPGALDALPALCRRFRVRQFDLFGSIATDGHFDSGRCDRQFLVASYDRLLPGAYVERIARFAADRSFEGCPTDNMPRAVMEWRSEATGGPLIGLRRADPAGGRLEPRLPRHMAFRATADDHLP